MRAPAPKTAPAVEQRPPAKPLERLVWLDAARLLAMGMVALQHLITICDLEPPRVLLGLDPGQIGVAMFFAISGLLAAGGRYGNPINWLSKRLSRIYVPYWIAVAGVLSANYIVQYKPAPLSLVIAEFAGVVGWTHRGDIVGIYFWFVSLLLFCYLLAAVVKFDRRVLPVMIVGSIAWLWWDLGFASNTLAFLTGLSLGQLGKRPSPKLTLAIALLAAVLTLAVNPGFACVTIAGLTILTTAIPFSLHEHAEAIIAKLSELSYHFYLVHVPFYLAADKLFPNRIGLVFLLGTTGAAVGAVALYVMETYVRKGIATLYPSGRPAQTA
ncbi:acyltransferase [Blastopirellula sp. JC732]|uniref:Acyltransferase n=1 Tax=Blastopirellula sediminis TaxID=2894196 RepID=A0A9X1MMZ6_9BACT|nr:acyltransferase [Blastopirellula sediminis]MCC9606574.1 acyltransferase [Blastopirellula sediminis]MCC9630128.1 acyltransferase [Blastopirellula sediminis]